MANRNSKSLAIRNCVACGLAIAALIVYQNAYAEILTLGGIEANGDGSYGYAGIAIPLPGSKIGKGFVQRYWIDTTTYSYAKNDQTIEARANSVEAALGYQDSGADGWWGTYLGLVHRDTQLSPDDPQSEARGANNRIKVLLEGERRISQKWRANFGTSYLFGQEAYWLRTRLLYGAPNAISTGPELLFHGDPDYKATHIGWVVSGIKPSTNIDVGLKLGMRRIQGQASKPYVGLELGWTLK